LQPAVHKYDLALAVRSSPGYGTSGRVAT
jgi:hypothetical protein